MGSALSIECPPAMGIPALAQTLAPPARIAWIMSTGITDTGIPTIARAKIGFAPIA